MEESALAGKSDAAIGTEIALLKVTDCSLWYVENGNSIERILFFLCLSAPVARQARADLNFCLFVLLWG